MNQLINENTFIKKLVILDTWKSYVSSRKSQKERIEKMSNLDTYYPPYFDDEYVPTEKQDDDEEN